ncbi:MAG: hypothetical protein ACLRSE_01165 [Alistipes finegoldii]
MSETYYSGYDSDRGRKPRRSLLLRLLDLLMTLLTAVTAVTMVVTFFVPYVDPGRVWFFPVLGLAHRRSMSSRLCWRSIGSSAGGWCGPESWSRWWSSGFSRCRFSTDLSSAVITATRGTTAAPSR